MKNKNIINLFIILIAMLFAGNSVFAITENSTKNDEITLKQQKVKQKDKIELTEQTEYTNDIHTILSLKNCIAIAVKYNPEIRSYMHNEDIFKSRIGQEWANYFPELSVGIEVARNKNQYTPSKYQGYLGTYNTMGYLPNISANMLLFDFGKTKAAADRAKRLYEAEHANTMEDINTIICAIKTSYYNILFAQKQVRVYEDTVKDYELQLKQAWGFYNLGKKAKIDVVTAEYNLGKAQLNLVKAKNVLEVSQIELSKIMGIPEYTNYELSDEMSLNKYEQNVDDALKQALEVRPELLSAQKKVNAAKMELRAKRRAYTPNLELFAGYGNGLGSEYNLSSANFGVELSYNRLNILRVQKQIKEADAYYKKAIAEYENVKDAIYFNVRKNHAELLTAKEAIIIAKLSLDQAQEQYRQVTGRYKAGIGNAIELKDGENTYLNARLDFYNAILNYNVTAANLEKEIGLPLQFSDEEIF